jgi:trimethylamine:corrinoid methyltransferase-like protein
MFAQTGLRGDFLKLKETRELFRREQHFPSNVIDRGALSSENGNHNILERARFRANELLAGYAFPPLARDRERSLISFAEHEARKVGVSKLSAIHRQDACVTAPS